MRFGCSLVFPDNFRYRPIPATGAGINHRNAPGRFSPLSLRAATAALDILNRASREQILADGGLELRWAGTIAYHHPWASIQAFGDGIAF